MNFYYWFLNVCTEKPLLSIENVYQRQNSIKHCDQLFTLLSQYVTNTYYAPTNMQATHGRTKSRDNKNISQLIILINNSQVRMKEKNSESLKCILNY